MLFVFPGLTYMTTFPPLFQPWPTAGKYHSTLFPTKPLSVSLPAGACVMSIAGSDPMYQPSTRVHIPSVGWKHWGYGWPRDLNPGPLRWKLSALPLWAIQTTLVLHIKDFFRIQAWQDSLSCVFPLILLRISFSFFRIFFIVYPQFVNVQHYLPEEPLSGVQSF